MTSALRYLCVWTESDLNIYKKNFWRQRTSNACIAACIIFCVRNSNCCLRLFHIKINENFSTYFKLFEMNFENNFTLCKSDKQIWNIVKTVYACLRQWIIRINNAMSIKRQFLFHKTVTKHFNLSSKQC